MTTYEEAIKRAAKPLAEAFSRIQEGTAREAAERAYTPGGPGLDELEERIQAWRDEFMMEQGDKAAAGRDHELEGRKVALLSDQEVAEQIGCSVYQLRADRALDRGDRGDRAPAWIEVGTSWRPRARGTRQSAVDAWLDRHETGGSKETR